MATDLVIWFLQLVAVVFRQEMFRTKTVPIGNVVAGKSLYVPTCIKGISFCQRCLQALSRQMGLANGYPVAALYFNPRGVHNSERVRQVDLGARWIKMSPQHSSRGSTSGAYFVIASCCTS